MSHVSMSTFWSGTDLAQMRTFPANWGISIVVNNKGQYLARYDCYEPVHVIIDNLPIIIEPHMPEGLTEQVAAEIAASVKEQGYHAGTSWAGAPTYVGRAAATTGYRDEYDAAMDEYTGKKSDEQRGNTSADHALGYT